MNRARKASRWLYDAVEKVHPREFTTFTVDSINKMVAEHKARKEAL